MTILAAFLVISAVAVPIVLYVTVNIPAQVKYQNLMGADATLAVEGPGTFQGIYHYVDALYAQMNATFPQSKFDWNTTYNSGFYWDHTYDNSLSAQAEYLQTSLARITLYEHEYANVSSTGQLTDVYNTAIKNLRSELNASGGIDWVLNGAWYLNYAPLAYWDWFYMLGYAAIAIVLAAVLLVFRPEYSYREDNESR